MRGRKPHLNMRAPSPPRRPSDVEVASNVADALPRVDRSSPGWLAIYCMKKVLLQSLAHIFDDVMLHTPCQVPPTLQALIVQQTTVCGGRLQPAADARFARADMFTSFHNH